MAEKLSALKLFDLSFRVEELRAPNRQLDEEIDSAIVLQDLRPERPDDPAESLRSYTSNLDDAITLVPRDGNWRWLVGQRPNLIDPSPYSKKLPRLTGFRAEVHLNGVVDPDVTQSLAISPAIAFTAAALRALAAVRAKEESLA